MKRLSVLAAVIAAGFAASASAQGSPIPPVGDIEKVSEDLYKVFGAGGNTIVFERENDVVLVDTKLPGNGQAIMDQVRKITDKPVGLVVITHAHPDHIGSNDFFTAQGIPVVAHANAAARMASPQSNPSRAPDQTFEDKLVIGEGEDAIELYYFGRGHTDNDTFVVFPDERAMMTGDIMAWNMAPLIDPPGGGTVISLPVTLTQALYGIDGVDTVIEGHGNVNSWDGFHGYVTFNRALLDAARTTLEQGGTPEDALAQLERNPGFGVFLKEELLPGLEYGGTPKSRALININVAFQELKGEPVTTNWGPRPPAAPDGQGAPSGQ